MQILLPGTPDKIWKKSKMNIKVYPYVSRSDVMQKYNKMKQTPVTNLTQGSHPSTNSKVELKYVQATRIDEQNNEMFLCFIKLSEICILQIVT